MEKRLQTFQADKSANCQKVCSINDVREGYSTGYIISCTNNISSTTNRLKGALMLKDSLAQVDIQTAGLDVVERECVACSTPNLKMIPKRDHEHNPLGVVCKCCAQKIWVNGRYGPLKKRWADYQDAEETAALQSMEATRKWIDEVNREFFALLPPCPVCGGHEYKLYNVMEPIPCAHCGTIGNIADVRDVTSRHYGDVVWWFGPLAI
jgi:hypothetical protein